MSNNQELIIPKIYRKKYEDLSMFFFIEAQRQIVPTITNIQAIRNYYRFIKQDLYDINVACVTLSRMRAAFIDFNYEKH